MKRYYFESKETKKSNDIIRDINDEYQDDMVKSLKIIDVYDVYVKGEFNDVKSLFNPLLEKEVFDINLDDQKYIWFRSLNGQFNQNQFNKVKLFEAMGYEGVNIEVSTIYIFDKNVNLDMVSEYLINPLEYEIFSGQERNYVSDTSMSVEIIDDFIGLNNNDLEEFLINRSLSMNIDDLKHIQNYFISIKRNPTITEILMLDTYWSDHCRHTTFETELVSINYQDSKIKNEIEDALRIYLELRDKTNRNSKPITLMDMASIEARYLKQIGMLEDKEESDEINACSIEIDIDVDGVMERWLLMYKNETHNHPTEIEPYGGASTCVGGAIRDPLSGRSYVYQAIRLTGAGDVRNSVKDKLDNKLSQRFITKRAALGNSSYGNQIGSATSYVREFYNEGYVAKRMELGAVVGAIKKSDVTRGVPKTGDIIIILGAPTGRDGVGAATGSSKKEASDALENAFAQVQKGNAMEERKIQRLFKRKEVSTLIKKANDLGAGGVSVAIGELADGLVVNLEKLYTKYDGLTPTELALSESQERMVVVVDPKDEKLFLDYCSAEDLEAASVAYVSNNDKLVMKYYDEIIVSLDREFLDTNGVRQKIEPNIIDSNKYSFNSNSYSKETFSEMINAIVSDLNNSNQENLGSLFDSTGQRSMVLAMYGGKNLSTLSEVSAQKIPTPGFTNQVSLLSCGLNPKLGLYQPFYAGAYSIVEAVSRLVAVGFPYDKARLSLQEYFESVTNKPNAFGKPVAALLGALKAQYELGLPALGGKDSMSGNFEDIKVPPTIAAFAVGTIAYQNIISNEFKQAGNNVYLLASSKDEKIDYELLKSNYDLLHSIQSTNDVLSCSSIKEKGILAELINMSYGNSIGLRLNDTLSLEDMCIPMYGSFIIETSEILEGDNLILIGRTIEDNISYQDTDINIKTVYDLNKETLANVFYEYELNKDNVEVYKEEIKCHLNLEKKDVNVFVPVFYGTNNEDEIYASLKYQQVNIDTYQFKSNNYQEGINELVNSINNCDVFILANIAYSEDDSDGSTKYVYHVLKDKRVKHAIESLIKRQGIIYGMGSGFKVLLELGLVNEGKYTDKIEATLQSNAAFISAYKEVEVQANENLFFKGISGKYVLPYAGGYSGVVSSKAINANQIVSTIDNQIEAMISPNGLILGRLCFSERYELGTYLNVPGNKQQDIMKNIINYFMKK
ncbi:MAG: phosphoribosylformylglycinamidine synthase [Erysipelotrichales bacterium]